MNINWKVRLQSPAFWLGIVPLIFILIQVVGAPFGLDVATLMGWEDYIVGIINAVFGILTFLGVSADPTTQGLSDSERALTYTKPA